MHSVDHSRIRGAVTVIAPLKNAEQFVPSLVSQLKATLRDQDRVVFVDDASEDGTLRLIEAAREADARFMVLTEAASRGVAHARNRAVAEVRTEFVWFIDHDDEWEPDALATMVSAIADADILFARADYRTDPAAAGRIVDGIDEEKVLDARAALRLMLGGQIHGYLWCKLFRTEVLGRDPFPLLSSQSDFCGVVAAVSRSRWIRTEPTIVYHYLWRAGSITRRKKIDFANFGAARETIHHHAIKLGLEEHERRLLTEFDCRFYVHALAFVPIRQNSPKHVRVEGFELARAELNALPICDVLPNHPRLFLEMTLIRLGRVSYSIVTMSALWLFDRRARFRSVLARRAS